MNFDQIETTIGWRPYVEEIVASADMSLSLKEQFHSVWITCGHRIREQVGNDELLAEFLWKILPRFSGGQVTLFRGENRWRWENGQLGFCWSSRREVAAMFGRGLNAISSGGVLLQIESEIEAIIAGPSDHSEYLNELEFTVDPRRLANIRVVEKYSAET